MKRYMYMYNSKRHYFNSTILIAILITFANNKLTEKQDP